MAGNIVLAIVGAFFATAGILLIRYRAILARAHRNANRSFFGKAGNRAANSSTPALVALIGSASTIMGLATIFMSFFYRGH